VLVCVAVAVVTVLVQLPRSMRTLDARAERWPTFSYEDREFGAGNSIIPDKQVLYEARAVIARSARYAVITGDAPIEDAREFTRQFAPDFARFFLMPRRPDQSAPWVICLGCDPARLPEKTQTLWTNGQGSSLLRVEGR